MARNGRALTSTAARLIVAVPLALLAWQAATWVRFGVDIPLVDDWRPYLHGVAGSFDLGYLFTPENDTLYPIGKAMDSLAQWLLGGNVVAYQLLSMVAVLGLVLLLQWRLLRRAARNLVLCAVAMSLTLMSLGTLTYWGQTNLGYDQAAPVVCLLAAILLAVSVRPRRWVTGAAVALGVVAGLFYVSGAIASLAAGVTMLVLAGTIRPRRPHHLGRCGLGLAIAGTVTTALQLWSLAGAPGTSRIPLGLPIEASFWRYLLGIVAHSLLLPAGTPALSFVISLGVVLVATIAGVVAIVRLVTGRSTPREQRVSLVYLSLASAIVGYLMLVTAGRLHLGAGNPGHVSDLFVAGFGRFYQWWVTIIWPWLVVLIAIWMAPRARTLSPGWRLAGELAALGLALLVMVAIGATGSLDYVGQYAFAQRTRVATARCLEQALASDVVMPCRWSSIDVDLVPAVLFADSVGASFVSDLHPQGPDIATHPIIELTGAQLAGMPGHGIGAVTAVPDGVAVTNVGDPYLLITTGQAAAMAQCGVLRVRLQLRSDVPETSEVFTWRPSAPPSVIGPRQSATLPGMAQGWTDVSVVLLSSTGFQDRVRVDPVAGAQPFELGSLSMDCLHPLDAS